ncbi:MAG: hypothetical protein GC164_09855 [Phycisphaera sp.]|nr:hypothetical protein [Phycisphaera sp.]
MANHPQYVICPYCGHTQEAGERCVVCRGLFEPLSRRATQIAMGPWFIRDKDNPFRPGCSFEVLKRQVETGRIKPTTVMRGPTTRQFWQVARNVPGVSHLLGYCYNCGEHVKSEDKSCPKCRAVFTEPTLRNEMGLLYPTHHDVKLAQAELEAEQAAIERGDSSGSRGPMSSHGSRGPGQSMPTASGSSSQKDSPPGTRIDLLDEVLGSDKPSTAPLRKGAGRLLEMEDKVPAQGDQSKTTDKAKPKAQALDFAPSERSADEEGSIDEPFVMRKSGSSLWTWLLISLNLLLLVLIGFVIYRTMQPATESGAGGSTSGTGVVEPDIRATQTASPTHTGTTRIVTDTTPQTAGQSIFSDEPTHVGVPTSTSPTTPLTPTTPTPPKVNPIQAQFNRASAFEAKGDLEQALAILRELSGKLAAADKPAGLDDHIAKLEREIERKKNASFFGITTE